MTRLEQFLEWVGDREIPDPDHCPREFAYVLRLFNYYNPIESTNDQTS